MLRSSLVLVIGFALGACGGPGGDAREPDEVAAQYQGPIQSSDVAQGEVLYNSLCMSCHGGGAPALEGIGWEPGAMRQRVREGGGRMPAITESRLSDPDLEAILAYMTTNGGVVGELSSAGGEAPVEGAEPAAEGAEGEPAAGDAGAAVEGEDAL